MKRRKYLVKVTINYFDDGYLYETTTKYCETIAVSTKQAINNVRYRIIGKKYKIVDHYPYSERYAEEYNFEIVE